MRTGFDIPGWVLEVATKKPAMDVLAFLLEQYGAKVEVDQDSSDVAALHYSVAFAFECKVIVTIGIILMDHQTNSDVVIETMTTRPEDQKRKGSGGKAIAQLVQWAKDNGLKELRATQVSGEENENFWIKNGFVKQGKPNPCNDFVLIL